MWLKKKFVLETNWLVAVDRIPNDLRQIVADNARQWQRWEDLGFKPAELSLGSPSWRSREYLGANGKLRYFVLMPMT